MLIITMRRNDCMIGWYKTIQHSCVISCNQKSKLAVALLGQGAVVRIMHFFVSKNINCIVSFSYECGSGSNCCGFARGSKKKIGNGHACPITRVPSNQDLTPIINCESINQSYSKVTFLRENSHFLSSCQIIKKQN